MLKFHSLYSGSTGNSLLIQSENTNLLVDAGVSAKKLESALTNLDVDIHMLDGILVTHEHSDHVQGLGTISKKYQLPVYATSKTWDAMPLQKDKVGDSYKKYFKIAENFDIGDLTITPFKTPHDAAESCGFSILHENQRLSIATDLGHMTREILNAIEGSSFLMLESNYDPEILKVSSYPYLLKTRIAGPNGHLSNELAGKTISYLLKNGLREVMLGHLSKENNFPELAYKTVLEELIQENFDENKIRISVASRQEPSKLVEVV